MEIIIKSDVYLFHLINQSLANPVFDFVMPIITEFKNFVIPLVILSIWLLYKKRLTGLDLLITLGVTILLTDQLSSHVLKPIFERFRPCSTLPYVRLITGHCNSSFSFPSSHAANCMGAAIILSSWFKHIKYMILFFTGAFLVSYSRPYIGVHYPFDLLGGWVLAVLCSLLVLKLRKKIFSFLKK